MAALIVLAVLAAAALGLMGWNQWSTTEMVKTQTRCNETLAREWREATLTLVLGYRDSAQWSEPPTTEPSETEASPRDELNLDDMPDHIREAYLREATEDEARISSIHSFPQPTTSS